LTAIPFATLSTLTRLKTATSITDLSAHAGAHLIDNPITVIILPVTDLIGDGGGGTAHELALDTEDATKMALEITLALSVLIDDPIYVIILIVTDLRALSRVTVRQLTTR
jgi:hypothetical protein